MTEGGSFLKDNWTWMAGIGTLTVGLVSWWSSLLWKISANVATTVQTLKQHEVRHDAHEARFAELEKTDHEHDKRITVLEKAAERGHVAPIHQVQ